MRRHDSRLEQEITITSDPGGAQFQLGELTGTTPCAVVVDRNRHPLLFRCALPGHEQAVFQLESRAQSLFSAPGPTIVNFLESLLIVPGIIDLAAANMWDYPEKVQVAFAKAGEGLSVVSVWPSRKGR